MYLSYSSGDTVGAASIRIVGVVVVDVATVVDIPLVAGVRAIARAQEHIGRGY